MHSTLFRTFLCKSVILLFGFAGSGAFGAMDYNLYASEPKTVLPSPEQELKLLAMLDSPSGRQNQLEEKPLLVRRERIVVCHEVDQRRREFEALRERFRPWMPCLQCLCVPCLTPAALFCPERIEQNGFLCGTYLGRLLAVLWLSF